MSTVNKSALLTTLCQQVTSTSTSVNIENITSLALAGKILGETNVITVADVAQLPDLYFYPSPDGMLYFVDSIGVYAISFEYRWLTLDGRQLRQDSDFIQAWTWGYNGSGRLGDNTTANKSSPVSVVGITDWCQVSSLSAHNLGIRASGAAWAWGSNTCGQLGTGDLISRSSPVSVVGGFKDWCQVSAGATHSTGLRANGTIWSWGCGGFGVLGNNSITNRSSPVSIVGGFTDWCQVSTNAFHTLALRSNGTAWAWGANSGGRLGDNSITSRSSPVSVVGGFTDWCQIAAARFHSLGVRTNGTAWAWGYNTCGRLGDGTVVNSSSPVSVVGGFTDWCQVSGGIYNSVGVRTNGTAWTWGVNSTGQLGDNTVVDKSSPVSVVGGFTDWCFVRAGWKHNHGIRTNGTLWTWGCNTFGELGDGTTTTRSSPVSVVGGFTNWTQISNGDVHGIALRGCA